MGTPTPSTAGKYEFCDEGGQWPLKGLNLDDAWDEAVDAVLETSAHTDETYWIKIHVRNPDDDDDAKEGKVAIDPIEPRCTDDREHKWDQVGLQGSGGGVLETGRCVHCRLEAITNTWAYDRTDGEEGMHSVRYSTDAREAYEARELG